MINTRSNRLGVALLFLAPNLTGFLLFTLGPVLFSFFGSFTTWSLKPSVPLQFIGLENFEDLFTDPNFYFYLFNTVYMLLAMPVGIALSLGLAVFLSQKLELKKPGAGKRIALIALAVGVMAGGLLFFGGARNTGFIFFSLGVITAVGLWQNSIGYRTFLYLPCFTAGAGTILLWVQLYNPNFGLINQVIGSVYHTLGIHADPPGWLTSTRCLLGFLPLPATFNNGGFGLGAREAMIIMGLWGGIGGSTMILYLAGISNIPLEMYEAADIDGANGWQKFRYITFPQLAPTTFFIVVMGLIGGMQGGFEQAQLMTGGGPAGTTTTLAYYIYSQGFQRLDLGYGCAVSWVLFLITMVITLINWRYGNQSTD